MYLPGEGVGEHILFLRSKKGKRRVGLHEDKGVLLATWTVAAFFRKGSIVPCRITMRGGNVGKTHQRILYPAALLSVGRLLCVGAAVHSER